MTPLYSVGTWDTDLQAFTPHEGLDLPIFNITKWQVKAVLCKLRQFGYSCHRPRDVDGEHWDSDPSVLVERTDGMPEEEILQGWLR